jgi:hypothetical protein
VSSPFTRCGRWSRRTSLALASLIVLTPCAILTATLPGNGNNGFIDIGSFWLWQKKGTLKPPVNAGSCSRLRNHGGYFPSGNWISSCLTSVPRHPDILINGSDVRKILVIICGLLAVAMVGTALANHDDHGLLFGSATVFFALTAAAACVSVFARKHVEDQAGRTFVVLVALSLILLVLAAHDWARRQLVIAAVVVAAALSMFIVRVGFESLKVPPQWERSQVASRATATENALSSQYKDEMPALRAAVADARTALNDIVHGRTPPNVAQVVLTTANTIIKNAKTWPATGKADNSDDFSQFDKQVADEDVRYPPAATAALADAVHALQAAETAATKPADRKPLDQAICVINPPPDLQCPAGPVTEITTNLAWVTDRHELDVQLAAYRAQVTGTQADQSALQAVLAQRPAADEDISLLTAIENGPETLWRSAFHAAGPALVPGPLGWAVFGVLLLGLLSWLLKVNASQLAGPVSVADVEYGGDGSGNGNGSGNGKAPGNGKDQLTAALRVAVLQNVAEPGAAPGSPSTNPVTTLLDIAGGPLSAANKIVQAVQAVVGRRFGYRVTIDVTTGNLAGSGLVSRNTGAVPATPAETSVLVRVMSLTSGVTYASHLCEAPDELEAVWTAGLWAAGYTTTAPLPTCDKRIRTRRHSRPWPTRCSGRSSPTRGGRIAWSVCCAGPSGLPSGRPSLPSPSTPRPASRTWSDRPAGRSAMTKTSSASCTRRQISRAAGGRSATTPRARTRPGSQRLTASRPPPTPPDVGRGKRKTTKKPDTRWISWNRRWSGWASSNCRRIGSATIRT